MKEVIILSAFVTTVWTLNDFEIVWCMTRGGPSHATELVSTYSYIQGFMNSNIAKSVAKITDTCTNPGSAGSLYYKIIIIGRIRRKGE